jgi:hypothetical protein
MAADLFASFVCRRAGACFGCIRAHVGCCGASVRCIRASVGGC